MEFNEFVQKAKHLEKQKWKYEKEQREQISKTIYVRGDLDHINRLLLPYVYELENNPTIFDKPLNMFWIEHYFSLKITRSKAQKEKMIQTVLAKCKKLLAQKERLQNEVNELKRQLL